MNLLPFFLVTLGIFALLSFALIPAAERRLQMDPSMASIKSAAYISLLGFLRSVFLVAMLTSAVLLLAVLILRTFSGATVSEVTGVIERLTQWRGIITGFRFYWGTGVTLFLVAALGLYARRNGRISREKVFQKLYDQKFEELKQKLEAGELEKIEPSAEMRVVGKRYLEAIAALESRQQESTQNETETFADIQDLLKQIAMLEQYYTALDLQRRIVAEIDPDDVALPEPKNLWEKVQTFFISRGLLTSLNASSRLLYFASLILLIPALLGIYSVSSASAFNDRIIQLKDLRVQLTGKEYEQEKALLGQPENELSAEDARVLEEIARSYEETSTPSYTIPVPMRASVYAFRSNLVRETVMSKAAAHANAAKKNYAEGAYWEKYPSGTEAGDMTPAEKAVVDMPEKAAATHAPVTPQGRKIYTEMADLAKRSPGIKQRLIAFWKSFQQPASKPDLMYALINKIAHNAAEGVPGDLADLFEGIDLKDFQATSKSFDEARSNRIFSALIKNEDLQEVFRKAGSDFNSFDDSWGPYEKADFQNTMRTVTEKAPFAGINQKFAEHPPTISITQESHVNMGKVTAEMDHFNTAVSNLPNVKKSFASASPLMEFNDVFPGQLGVELRTDHGALAAKWGRSSASAAEVAEISKASFARAQNFSSLRGFEKVGGVLIGQNPADVSEGSPSKLNFTGLRWELADGKVRFVLTDNNGKEFRSCPFRASIAYHALNYAADGRPTTATMMKADPLSTDSDMFGSKILLHPTLVDSALGQRLIDIDRFVFDYTEHTPAVKEAMEKFYEDEALYAFAVYARYLVPLEDANSDALRKERDYYKKLVANEALRTTVAKTLQDTASIADPEKSPLTVKKEFFDPELVDVIVKLPNGSTPAALVSAIRARFRGQWEQVLSSRDEKKIDAIWERWMSFPPDLGLRSGVREHRFNASISDIFVAENTEIPMPFDFTIHVVFSSAPVFIAEEKAQNYIDPQPWEFPSIRDEIRDTVLTRINKDKGKALMILSDASEFAMLQRMFRVIFGGHMGAAFPVEKLLELNKDLSEVVPASVARTPRWDAKSPQEVSKSFNEDKALNSLFNLSKELNIKKEFGDHITGLYEALGIKKDYDQLLRNKNSLLAPLE